jgi:hypothetical protein
LILGGAAALWAQQQRQQQHQQSSSTAAPAQDLLAALDKEAAISTATYWFGPAQYEPAQDSCNSKTPQ